MRQSIRGWRSARAFGVRAGTGATQVMPPPTIGNAFVNPVQEPLRFGLGLAALTLYLWIIHSYKLPSADIAVMALGVGVLLRGGRIEVPAPLIFFGLLILWSATGFAVTLIAPRTSEQFLALVKLWIIAFGLINVIKNAAELRYLVIAWLGLYALYPVRGALYNQFICHCTEFGRVAWNFVFENPNDLAAITLLPLGLAAGVAYVERVKLWRVCGLIGVGVLSLTVMLTQSRGAMLGVGLGVLLLVASSRNKVRDVTLLFLFMGGAALAAPRGVWERLAGLTNVSVQEGMRDVDPEGSAQSRWKIWQIAGATIRDNPLTGVGLSMMPVVHRNEASRRNEQYSVRGERDTHSTYLRLTAETGFPGLIFYLLMWGSVIWKLRMVRRRIRAERLRDHQFLLFLEIALMSFMVASIFGTYPYMSFTYVSICTAWLAATILEREPWYVPEKERAQLLAPATYTR